MYTHNRELESSIRQVFVYLTGMSECRPVHRTMLHNKILHNNFKQFLKNLQISLRGTFGTPCRLRIA